MAIEDAAVLASCITPDVAPTAALRRYEGLRKPRTSKIQRVSPLNARIFHARGPWVGVRNRSPAHRHANYTARRRAVHL